MAKSLNNISEAYDSTIKGNQKICLILSAPPGAGKSTATNYITNQRGLRNTVVCSADDHFIQPDKTYVFDPKKIGQAHIECKKKFLHALQGNEFSTIIVDNTNTSPVEVAFYYDLASLFNFETMIWRLTMEDWNVAFNRNVHNIPRPSFDKLLSNFLDFPKSAPWWWKTVNISV